MPLDGATESRPRKRRERDNTAKEKQQQLPSRRGSCPPHPQRYIVKLAKDPTPPPLANATAVMAGAYRASADRGYEEGRQKKVLHVRVHTLCFTGRKGSKFNIVFIVISAVAFTSVNSVIVLLTKNSRLRILHLPYMYGTTVCTSDVHSIQKILLLVSCRLRVLDRRSDERRVGEGGCG